MPDEMQQHNQTNLDELGQSSNVGGGSVKQKQDDFQSAPNVLATAKSIVIKERMSFLENEFWNNNGLKIKLREILDDVNSDIRLNDYLLSVTNLGLARTLTLPNPKLAGFGKTFIVKDGAGGASSTTITVAVYGTETIDGGAGATITTDYDKLRLYTDGTNWFSW